MSTHVRSSIYTSSRFDRGYMYIVVSLLVGQVSGCLVCLSFHDYFIFTLARLLTIYFQTKDLHDGGVIVYDPQFLWSPPV